jgi:hypothetical protein
MNKLPARPFMSHARPTASSSSNFQLIIDNALDKYEKRTKNDLLVHPLASLSAGLYFFSVTLDFPDLFLCFKCLLPGREGSPSSVRAFLHGVIPILSGLVTLAVPLYSDPLPPKGADCGSRTAFLACKECFRDQIDVTTIKF